MALPEFSVEDHVMKHLFMYTRLLLLVSGWFMVKNQPVIFLGFVATSLVIANLDKIIIQSQPRPQQIQKMLMLVMDKITSYVLIFALISYIKTHTDSEDMGHPSMIWVSMFIMDFTSTWFRQYSIYLAGERTEVVASPISRWFLSFYRNSFLGQLVIDNAAEFFIICQICIHSDHKVLQRQAGKDLFPIVCSTAMIFSIYRAAVFIVELKQGFVRIIDLDCDDYNVKYGHKKAADLNKKEAVELAAKKSVKK